VINGTSCRYWFYAPSRRDLSRIPREFFECLKMRRNGGHGGGHGIILPTIILQIYHRAESWWAE